MCSSVFPIGYAATRSIELPSFSGGARSCPSRGLNRRSEKVLIEIVCVFSIILAGLTVAADATYGPF